MLVGPHIKYQFQIMRRYCCLWALRRYPLLIMNWQLDPAREERRLEDGRGFQSYPHYESSRSRSRPSLLCCMEQEDIVLFIGIPQFEGFYRNSF
uniref:Putative thiol methyltransferase 2 isoform X2 n=1 Tax=Rhizophora mucronata TaxID=61149 RepID=A0A2P2KLQ9_RHIMU